MVGRTVGGDYNHHDDVDVDVDVDVDLDVDVDVDVVLRGDYDHQGDDDVEYVEYVEDGNRYSLELLR